MIITVDGVRRLAESRPPHLNSYWTASAHKRSRTHDSHAVIRRPCQQHEFQTYAELSSIYSAPQATILLRVPGGRLRVPGGRPTQNPCAYITVLCASIPRFLLERLELGLKAEKLLRATTAAAR